jgi:hypothetical protein
MAPPDRAAPREAPGALASVAGPALLLAALAGAHALLKPAAATAEGWDAVALRVLATLAWLAGTVLVIRIVDLLV